MLCADQTFRRGLPDPLISSAPIAGRHIGERRLTAPDKRITKYDTVHDDCTGVED